MRAGGLFLMKKSNGWRVHMIWRTGSGVADSMQVGPLQDSTARPAPGIDLSFFLKYLGQLGLETWPSSRAEALALHASPLGFLIQSNPELVPGHSSDGAPSRT